MPRTRDPKNEKQRARTERWRKRLADSRRPEVDAVDTALAVAVSVLADVAGMSGSEAARARVSGLEIMAVNWLSSTGYSREHAIRSVARRVHRLDVHKLIPVVSGKPIPAATSIIPKAS